MLNDRFEKLEKDMKKNLEMMAATVEGYSFALAGGNLPGGDDLLNMVVKHMEYRAEFSWLLDQFPEE